MSALSLRLPESLHKAARVLAKKEHVSINQLIMLALAEKIAALEATDYLDKRGKLGNRERYLNILKKAPNTKPSKRDKL
jgi:hypothetical protein